MRKILAIGGARDRAKRRIVALDREVVRLAGKKRPRMLLIPTASHDRKAVCEKTCKVYARLGCRTDVLLLLGGAPSRRTMREAVGSADIVYVSGGNTLKMMRRWRHLGVDRLLRRADERGAVLAGSSAGGICWFDHGHSDSMRDYHPQDWDYIRVRGLGLLPFVFCPHLHGEGRVDSFTRMIARQGGIGIGCDDACAFEVIGDRWRVFAARRGAGAWRFRRQGGRVVAERLPTGEALRPLASLLR
jgi:dipeptidase E